MERLKDYFTLAGWKRDWEQTKRDVGLSPSEELSDIVISERESTSRAMDYIILGFGGFGATTVGLLVRNDGYGVVDGNYGYALVALGISATFIGLVGSSVTDK